MLGSLISGALSLGAGLLQRNDSKKAQQQEYERQKEFAKSGIQWKVEDAKAAGIHPLYAIGANTTSYAPQSVGDTGTGAMAQAGQDIGRAIDATRTAPQRMDAFTRTANALTLTKMGLENELLASQVAKVKQQIGPAFPTGSDTDYLIPGQGQTNFGLPAPPMHDTRAPQFTPNIAAFGKNVMPNPNFSDAQTYEDRYGEISDYIMGPGIAVADWFYNVKPYLNRQLYDKLRK